MYPHLNRHVLVVLTSFMVSVFVAFVGICPCFPGLGLGRWLCITGVETKVCSTNSETAFFLLTAWVPFEHQELKVLIILILIYFFFKIIQDG